MGEKKMRLAVCVLVAVFACLASAELTPEQFAELYNPGPIEESEVECVLCGVAMNEVEAMLKTDLCDKLDGVLKEACDLAVAALPVVIKDFDNRDGVGRICVGLHLCKMPFNKHPDPVPAPIFKIDMDAPAISRWDEPCSVPYYGKLVQSLINFWDSMLPGGGKRMEAIGADLCDKFFPWERCQEIKGCSAKLGASYGWVSIINLGYELSDACTSIISQDDKGHILHSRNLDFWDGWGFTDILRNLTFQADMQRNGSTVYHMTSLAGYMGVLSGMRLGGFSLTVDTRFYPDGFFELFEEVIAAIHEKNASLVTFLTRDVMDKQTNWDDSVKELSKTELIADVYYIVAGTKPTEG